MNFVRLLRFVPKNALSYMTGMVLRLRLPRPIFLIAAKNFVRLFDIDMSESLLPLESYSTLEEIFARRLKIGQRSTNGTFCSPADGVLVRSSILQEGREDMAVQCKGQDYSLGELVFGKSKANCETKFGSYSTIYLAPHNYHRVHSPCSGRIRVIRYIPGELWPVNNWACFRVPMLFLRNERLVFEIDLGDGGIVYVVMVGALNVGRIRTHLLDNFVTNGLKRQFCHGIKDFEKIEPVPITVGDELGVFLLGSTVIVVLNKEASNRYPLLQNDSKRNIIVGESLLRDS